MSAQPLPQSPLPQAPDSYHSPAGLIIGVGPCQDKIKEVDVPVGNPVDEEKVLDADVLQEAWHCLPLPEARLSNGPCTQTSLSIYMFVYIYIYI